MTPNQREDMDRDLEWEERFHPVNMAGRGSYWDAIIIRVLVASLVAGLVGGWAYVVYLVVMRVMR